MDDQKNLMDQVKVPTMIEDLLDEKAKEKQINSFDELVSATFVRYEEVSGPSGYYVVAWHNDDMALLIMIRELHEDWTSAGERAVRMTGLQRNIHREGGPFIGWWAAAPPPKEVMAKFQEARAHRLASAVGPDWSQWV